MIESGLEGILERLTQVLEGLDEASREPSEVPYSLAQLLDLAVQHRASLLHLNVGSPPLLRINEQLVPIGEQRLTRGDCRHLLAPVMNRSHLQSLEGGKEVDLCHAAAGTGFRFNLYRERGEISASIWRLRTDIPRLEDLGLSGGLVEQVLAETSGLVLLTGHPRCGKINTLASLLSHLNLHRPARIVSLEQPIQFWHQNHKATMIQREVGSDTASFAHGVQQAVLQDPDILALSELPDRDTAELIIRAAAGGHLVLAVLDASSAVRAVDRLVGTFQDDPDPRVVKTLSRALRLVICQTLVQRVDGRGMIPAFEILFNNDEVRQEIRESRIDSLHWIMQNSGMQTLGKSLSRLVEVGLVSQEEALRHVEDPSELELPIEASSSFEGSSSSQASVEETPLMSWL